MTERQHHVVVDGSNLATEGRTTPSLRQLDEAVRAYADEDPTAQIVVVVDASFEHRIDPSERAELEEAELNGELVSPPAGAVGRGDAFVLRIAERTDATVLSNDSFQEFHGEHPWLFDRGRLIGGKPVPGVGWIFTPRLPVRGPKSRQATGKAKRDAAAADLPAPVKAAELAKAARKVAAKRARLPDGTAPQIGDVWPPAGEVAPSTAAPAAEAVDDVESTTGQPVVAKKTGPSKKAGPVKKTGPSKKAAPAKKKTATSTEKAAKKTSKKAAPAGETSATKKVAQKKAAHKKVAEKAAAAGKKARATPTAEPVTVTTAAKKTTKKAAKEATKKAALIKNAASTKKAAKAGKAVKAAKKRAAPAEKATDASPVDAVPPVDANRPEDANPPAGAVEPPEVNGNAARPRRTRRVAPEILEAIDEATAEALDPPTPGKGPKSSDGKSSGRGAADGRSRRGGKGGNKGGKESKEKDKSPGRRRRSAAPPPAVNEPLAFITFVATYPLGSEVEGEVESFTSHGAMVEVGLPDGSNLFCYIPLAGLGDPPPTKARQVISRGERRRFVLVALDPPRRVAELALPELASAAARAAVRS
ncbi:MAG TPA: hypothetical protein VHX40_07890 [Acidimicrobiales bacterium]|jgi:hypothetical protein|nr:hypothetical protein [Acidimicrobiales bacterium]